VHASDSTEQTEELDDVALNLAYCGASAANNAAVDVQFPPEFFETLPLEGEDLARYLGIESVELKAQADLVRHIFGNPFRPHPLSDHWPATVVQLAQALYSDQDCSFALHDALLEAGHPELADHFRQKQAHPKGCWVVDLILGKE